MNAVAILGGMGPLAGVDLLQKFLAACACEMQARGIAVSDQAYPQHYLAQWPHPDRTKAIFASADDRFAVLASLSDAIAGMEKLGVRTVAIACNTAHAWHARLVAQHPEIEILNIAEVTAIAAKDKGIEDIGLLSTKGTCKARIYQPFLERLSIGCQEPNLRELDWLMSGIYQGVKANRLAFAKKCFSNALESMRARTGLDAFVMGCTEIPIVIGSQGLLSKIALIDPSVELAARLAKRAYETDNHRNLDPSRNLDDRIDRVRQWQVEP